MGYCLKSLLTDCVDIQWRKNINVLHIWVPLQKLVKGSVIRLRRTTKSIFINIMTHGLFLALCRLSLSLCNSDNISLVCLCTTGDFILFDRAVIPSLSAASMLAPSFLWLLRRPGVWSCFQAIQLCLKPLAWCRKCSQLPPNQRQDEILGGDA